MTVLGQEVSAASRDVDRLHLELSARAQLMIERLAPIARGEHTAMRDRKAVIPPAGHTVEVLAARTAWPVSSSPALSPPIAGALRPASTLSKPRTPPSGTALWRSAVAGPSHRSDLAAPTTAEPPTN
ncbi:hypothetical protein [Kitasatospora sp. NPDC059673]|uniref:hypothetical protein n=1 Tax=Kitasatospora sp. NPDC059673 TaxID=3346901 RepID=UPI003686844F